MPGDHNIPLPRTVPSDPGAAENERAVREAVEKLTAERDQLMARQDAARLRIHGFEPPRPFEVEGFPVESYRPREGDVLILQSDKRIPASVVERIKQQLAETFPGHKALILEGGMTFRVVREDS